MINLTDHSCSFCKHLNRYERTLHGYAVDAWKFYDHKIASLVETRKYGMIGYYRKERDRWFRRMQDIESGKHQQAYRYVISYHHHHASK